MVCLNIDMSQSKCGTPGRVAESSDMPSVDNEVTTAEQPIELPTQNQECSENNELSRNRKHIVMKRRPNDDIGIDELVNYILGFDSEAHRQPPKDPEDDENGFPSWNFIGTAHRDNSIDDNESEKATSREETLPHFTVRPRVYKTNKTVPKTNLAKGLKNPVILEVRGGEHKLFPCFADAEVFKVVNPQVRLNSMLRRHTVDQDDDTCSDDLSRGVDRGLELLTDMLQLHGVKQVVRRRESFHYAKPTKSADGQEPEMQKIKSTDSNSCEEEAIARSPNSSPQQPQVGKKSRSKSVNV